MSNVGSKEFFKRELSEDVTIIRKFTSLMREIDFGIPENILKRCDNYAKYMLNLVTQGFYYYKNPENVENFRKQMG